MAEECNMCSITSTFIEHLKTGYLVKLKNSLFYCVVQDA